MPVCKICNKPVTSGVVVHSECYEELNNFDNTQSKLLLIKISELRKENAELKARLEKQVVRGEWIYRHRHLCSPNVRRTGKLISKIFGETSQEETVICDERYEADLPYCGRCGKLNDSAFLNFCPNCGADMREVNNRE